MIGSRQYRRERAGLTPPAHVDGAGILLLCEVALGNSQELRKATALASAGRGKHSVKGLGKYVPDPKEHTELPGGVRVPIGALPASTPAAPQPGCSSAGRGAVGR